MTADPIADLLAQVAVLGLPGASGGPVDVSEVARGLPSEVDDAEDGAEGSGRAERFGMALVERAEAVRLLGALQAAVSAGSLVMPDVAVRRLAERHRATMLWCLHLELRLLEVREWFRDAGGVEHLVVKGPAVAHLDEVDPAARSFADVDLLVTAADMDRAVRAIEARGARRPWPERRPGYDRRFAKSVTLTCPDGVELDVHRSLCDGVHGFLIPLGDLFAEPDHFDLAGESVPALSRPHRFMHAAYHAVLGSPSPPLSALRDVARYLTSVDLPPSRVVPIAERWRGEAVLALAVRETFDALRFAAPAWQDWAAAVDLDPSELAKIERHRGEGSSLGPAKVDALWEVPGLWSKAAYATALAWPTRAHLAARGQRRRDALRNLGAALRR